MSEPKRVFITLIAEYYDFPDKCKINYQTHVNVDKPTPDKIKCLIECLKCGINAFEDEVTENDEDTKHKRYVLYEKYNKLLSNLYDGVTDENNGGNNE